MSIREIRRLVDFFEDTEFFIHFLHSPQRQNRGRDPLLARHRKVIAQKYDGSKKRGPGRPRALSDFQISPTNWSRRQ